MIYLGNQQVGLNSSQDSGSVSYVNQQALTDLQKERARNNINALSSSVATAATQGDTRPITSDAVYTILGNIETLLAGI